MCENKYIDLKHVGPNRTEPKIPQTEPNRTESFLKNFEPNRFRFGRFGSVRFETEPVPSLSRIYMTGKEKSLADD